METQAIAPNPWLTMWTRPRRTVRTLVETRPDHLVLLLAGLAGVGQVLDRASFRSMGDDYSITMILVAAVVLGPVFGIISLHVGAALIRWTGSWLGGSASTEHVRTALAWGGLPQVVGVFLWVPAFLLFGEELFTTATPRLEASGGLAALMVLYGLTSIVLGVWSIVLVLKGVGETHGFSAWRALGSVLLVLLMVVGAVFAVGLLLMLLARAVSP